MDFNDLGIADNFVDPKSVWLTANDTTIYAFVNIDVAQGPVVIEIPPGAIVGLMDDFWQRSLADVGLPGPDGDKGGKFLLAATRLRRRGSSVRLPRTSGDDEQPQPPGPRHHRQQRRARRRGARPEGQDLPVERARRPQAEQVRLDLGQADRHDSPGGMEFWARLSAVINNNPVQEHDRFFMAMLKPLGIEKGKPFKPDARQTAILEEAAGSAMRWPAT